MSGGFWFDWFIGLVKWANSKWSDKIEHTQIDK